MVDSWRGPGVTELDKLAVRAQRDGDAVARLTAERAALTATATLTAKDDRRAQSALATRRRRLDGCVAAGKTAGAAFARVAVEHQAALVRAEQTAAAAAAAREALAHNQARAAKLETQLADLSARRQHLEAQRTIRQLDVAQDMILTATKLTAMQLISFALRVYLTVLPMTADTFIARVFSLRGRKELEPTIEHVVFYENPRDPEVTAALHDACRRLNQRDLRRDGRQLRYSVERAPTETRSG